MARQIFFASSNVSDANGGSAVQGTTMTACVASGNDFGVVRILGLHGTLTSLRSVMGRGVSPDVQNRHCCQVNQTVIFAVQRTHLSVAGGLPFALPAWRRGPAALTGVFTVNSPRAIVDGCRLILSQKI